MTREGRRESSDRDGAVMTEAALEYVARGWSIFPLAPFDKIPLKGSAGFKDASTDLEAVCHWWSKHPTANIGTPTGAANKFFVIDIDPKKGGADEWLLLATLHGEPETRRVRTPSGGTHLYFRWPAGGGVRNNVNVWPGIDVRGEGGYVVAPPSVTRLKCNRDDPNKIDTYPGSYELIDARDPADAPDWILAAVVKAEHPRPALRVPSHGIPPILAGERNERLFRIARGCRADGYTEGQILERLRQLNTDGTVNPPVDELELATIARQGAAVPSGGERPADRERIEYHRTDLGNAQRLSDRHSGNIFWLTDSQSWLVWDGRRYRRDAGELVMRAAQETVGSIYREAAECADLDERRSLGSYAATCEREGKLRAAVSLAKSQSSVMATSEDFDREPQLLNVRNGVIDLANGTLSPHSQRHRLTRIANVDYDPDATCPTWLGFLERVMDGNADLIEYLRRAVGYSLTGLTQEHCLFMLHGTGANGKSTFTETLCDLLGEYAMHTQFSTWAATERGEATHEVAALAGARLVVSNEAEGGVRFAEGLVKQATGGDRMRGCFKYQNSFEFTPALKLWLALNHKPSVRGTDEGFWRRIRLIPFTVTIPPEERDPTLRGRLQNELDGILAWAVRGAFEWYHVGLLDPEVVREATRMYRSDQDVFADWIDECLSRRDDWSESGSEVYKSFKSWCERQGMKPMANNKLANLLKDKGFSSRKDRRGRMEWVGIKVVTEGDGGFDTSSNLLY